MRVTLVDTEGNRLAKVRMRSGLLREGVRVFTADGACYLLTGQVNTYPATDSATAFAIAGVVVEESGAEQEEQEESDGD